MESLLFFAAENYPRLTIAVQNEGMGRGTRRKLGGGSAKMYQIDYDEAERRIIVRVSGRWTANLFETYISELYRLMREVRGRDGFFQQLVLGAGMEQPSPEVHALFARESPKMLTLCPGRMAIVAGSLPAKARVEQNHPFERVRVFLSERDALEWLQAEHCLTR